jgi:spermidine dehydrogenase
MKKNDDLGMSSSITRRQFINGVAYSIGATAISTSIPSFALAHPMAANFYPPKLMGMRGSHPGSFEAAHNLARSGQPAPKVDIISGRYDLVVVGAGVSGLAAAHFYRKKKPDASILIIDNHDDFGGHAKRNEFDVDGKQLIAYGGSQSIEEPGDYPKSAKTLFKDLGIDVDKFETAFDHTFYKRHNMQVGMFFEELAGVNNVRTDFSVANYSGDPLPKPSRQQIHKLPLNKSDKDKLYELLVEPKNYLADVDEDDYDEILWVKSYQHYLQTYCGVSDELLNVFKQSTDGTFGATIDVIPAAEAWGYGSMPGFSGLDVDPDDYLEGSEPYIHHFPDGNASVARLLVRKMIPSVAPGNTMEDIVTAKFDYSKLDDESNDVQIRLNSTAVNVISGDDKQPAKITYIKQGNAFAVEAKHCILACYNVIIPFLMPELKVQQATALRQNVKTPLIYTNVAFRNWKAFHKLGTSEFYCADGFHSNIALDFPVSLGDYTFSKSPSEPIVAHLEHCPTNHGSNLGYTDRLRLGRVQLLTMSFEEIELKTRQQLTKILGPAGFDAARDIAGITVNRWPHGYSGGGKENAAIGRKKIGNVAIANSDAGASAMLQAAIDQSDRAVKELL